MGMIEREINMFEKYGGKITENVSCLNGFN